ncbi:MAG: preprotein translocase subunit SecE [Candidatus Liberibacter ctenarytainae]|uniref:Protein translocase subunit SecE n=1 Tax=Candidatus Liberibacter ctenarytainae TaxID=2020335 RepID=A0A937AEU4_9HYPH|nr:preprotein translocase subunit SecE [Candidatus Liberibacter ctenarytainae]
MFYIERYSFVVIDGLIVVKFFNQVKIEAKKIFWPTRNEVVVSVIVVIIMLIVSSSFFLLVDQCIGWVMRSILSISD